MIFQKNVHNPEGPVCLPDGSWLITEMDHNAISHVSYDGTSKRVIAQTGLPNGLTVDMESNIWVADAKWRMLLAVSMEGEITEVSQGNPNFPFLLPNDLCFGPDNAIYMTDSGILLDEISNLANPMEAYETSYDGRVFRIDPITRDCTLIDRGLKLTNGIAFGLQGNDLYVAETITGNIFRYIIIDGKSIGERELFSNVMIKPPHEYKRIAGPDGIAFDREGNLYVAVLIQGDITVITPSGEVKERIKLEGNLPTNLAFDSLEKKRILVCEASKNQLLLIETEHCGLPLFPHRSKINIQER